LPERLEKVKLIRSKTNIPIEVDGGVKDTTIQLALDAGATRFVATSFISYAKSPMEAYELLEKIINPD
jgi:pentose-5-phosphate-3-epimerase